MKRRLLPILMTLVLVCALPIWAAFVTSGNVTNPLVETAEATEPTLVDVDTPVALRQAIEAGNSVKLTSDTIFIDSTLVVTKPLTIDLNGRLLRRSQGTGSVIQVDAGATLTLTDSGNGSKTYPFKKNADWGYWEYHVNQGDTWFEGGIIAGGNAHAKLDDGNGGGVHVANGGTFIMEKGKIIGCQADKNGGGVYVEDGGKFIMNGGEINGCVTYSGDKGGNVYVGAGAVFQMGDSARITECIARASSGGGVYVAENGTFTMSGSSTIDNCKASSGGAVYNAGTFTMGGSSRIKDCTYYYGNTSGGVHNKGTFTVEGGSITGSMNDGSSGDDISNENKLDVSEGITISCNVKVGYGGTISKGTFTGRVWIYSEGTILDGTFANEVINYEGRIKAGEFTGKIENSYGKIDGGTFRGSVTSSGYNAIISDGNFHGTVTNESGATISGGTFDENVTNKTYAILNGGIFYGGVTNDGGTINDSAYVTVKFNSDNGAQAKEEKVLRGQKVAKPTDDPTKSGYTFIGWEDADGAYDFSKSVTAPLTLTAKWEKNPSSGGYYYYPTTDTKADDTKGSPKTADPGAALYGALALLSLTGMVALNGKKR